MGIIIKYAAIAVISLVIERGIKTGYKWYKEVEAEEAEDN